MRHFYISLSLVFSLFVLTTVPVFSQGRTHDIKVSELPKDVKKVLEDYIEALRSAETLDDAEKNVLKVMGGSLVNEDGETLRNSVKPYSLKKDWNNIKFYSNPIKITRVNSNPTASSSGFGESAIRGRKYKIWIGKKDGVAGLPAPISIIVPKDHPTIKSPKVVGIGSL